MLQFDYQLRAQACDHIIVTPEVSGDLAGWTPVPAGNTVPLGGNRFRASLPTTGSAQFLRLQIQLQ